MGVCTFNRGAGGGLVIGELCSGKKKGASIRRGTASQGLRAVGWRRGVLPKRRSLQVIARAGEERSQGNSSSSGSDDTSFSEEILYDGDVTPFDEIKFGDFDHNSLDWRSFRATLVAQEQIQPEDSDASTGQEYSRKPSIICSKWAHPISMPETGCVLLATEKLDGLRNFERTVILLLKLGTKDPKEGPVGVVISRPLREKINGLKSSNAEFPETFAQCRLHFGGPLDATMFLLTTNKNLLLLNSEQVMPGIYFGDAHSLEEAALLVKKGLLHAHDFNFFSGCAGWQLDQLLFEIQSGYWIVAACSSDLINGAQVESSSGLWEEILQMMGGDYTELSRRSRLDGF